MADNNANPFGNAFGVESTMEIGGAGDATLLQGLLEPESSTADPDKLQEIGKEIEPEKKETENLDDKLPSGEQLISSFLDEKDGEEEEEIIKEDVKAEVTEEKEEEKESKEEFNQFKSLAKDLYQLGVFTQEEGEEEPTTPETFLEKFNNEKKRGANEIIENFLGQFGEDRREAFDAIYLKGVDPKEYFNTFNEIVDLANIDLTQESNQEKVMRKSLTEQAWEPDDITAEIDRLKNYADLETVAARHHKVLVKKQTAELQQKKTEAEAVLQQKATMRLQYEKNVQTILQEKVKQKEFDGIPINPKLANELHDFLLVDKWKTEKGETLTDFDRTILELKRPENHAMKIKVALLLKTIEKDPTLLTLQRSAITKKSDSLFGELAKQSTKNSVKAPQGLSNSIFSKGL